MTDLSQQVNCSLQDKCTDSTHLHNRTRYNNLQCTEPNCCNNCIAIDQCVQCQQTIQQYNKINTNSTTTTKDKRRDKDFPKYAFKEGSTTIQVPHMYDTNQQSITIHVSNDDLQYDLKPTYLIDMNTQQPWIYYNAQNPQYYYRPLKSASILTIWLLIKNTQLHNGTYTKRRIVETCYNNNITIKCINPNKIDLPVSSSVLGNSNTMLYEGM